MIASYLESAQDPHELASKALGDVDRHTANVDATADEVEPDDDATSILLAIRTMEVEAQQAQAAATVAAGALIAAAMVDLSDALRYPRAPGGGPL